MATYKENRPVTSEKIKLEIERLFRDKYKGKFVTAAGTWRRVFRKGLPESSNQVRGFFGYATGSGMGQFMFAAIAMSDKKDQKLQSVYLLDGFWKNVDEVKAATREECSKLGVNEVMFSD